MARLSVRIAAVVTFVGLAVGCGSGPAVSVGSRRTPVVQVDPSQLVAPVTYRLTPSRSVELSSVGVDGQPDGALIVRAYSGVVLRETTLTIARVAAEYAPFGVVGDAFLISPEVTLLEEPVRLRLNVPAAALDDLGAFRLARLDTGDRFYRVLPAQAVVKEADLAFAGAASTTFGVFAVVDTRLVEVRDDNPPTETAAGLHLLDMGRVRAAHAHLGAAATSGDDKQALFGWGLTRMLQLFASPALDDLMAGCGQPLWDVDDLFGPGGAIDTELARGRAESHLTVSSGFDAANAVERLLEPTRVVAELAAQATCVDGELSLPAQHLVVTIEEPDYDGNGNRLELVLRLDVQRPSLNSSQSLATLLSTSSTGYVELRADEVNGQLWAERNASAQDKYDGRADAASADLVLSQQAPGLIRLHSAPVAVGDPVELEFVKVAFEPAQLSAIPETLFVSGTASPVVSEEALVEKLPLGTAPLEEVLQGCDPGAVASLDDRYLVERFAEIGAELDAIADLWIAAADDPGFRFDVSLGLVSSPSRLPIGAAEVNLIAGVLKLGVGALELLQAYRWWEGDLRELLVQIEDTHYETCDPCDYRATCPMVTELRWTFASRPLAAALNPVFLTRVGAGGDLTAMRDRWREGLDAALRGLAATTTDTLVSFKRGQAAVGTMALRDLLEVVRDALAATSHLDAVRLLFGETDLFLFLDGLFTDPPTIDTLRREGEALSTDPAFLVEIDSGAICAEPCTDETKLAVAPAGWLMSILDLYTADAGSVLCTAAADCATDGSVACATTCQFSGVEDTLQTVIDEFVDTAAEPPFINTRVLGELESSF